MLRVKDIPPEELPEVVRVAGELYDKEGTQDRERRATVEAAEEMGIPAEYMERAAREVHTRRVEQTKQTRRRRNGVVATLAVLVAVGGAWRVINPTPPAPTTYTQFDGGQWTLEKNAESAATVATTDGTAVIRVQRFGQQRDGDYFVNFQTGNVPPTLRGYETVSFRVRGSGLSQARLYLEESGSVRWRSPAVSITDTWQTIRLKISDLDRQTRRGEQGEWQRNGSSDPNRIERLSFKIGEYMNDPTARGEIVIDDLKFE